MLTVLLSIILILRMNDFDSKCIDYNCDNCVNIIIVTISEIPIDNCSIDNEIIVFQTISIFSISNFDLEDSLLGGDLKSFQSIFLDSILHLSMAS